MKIRRRIIKSFHSHLCLFPRRRALLNRNWVPKHPVHLPIGSVDIVNESRLLVQLSVIVAAGILWGFVSAGHRHRRQHRSLLLPLPRHNLNINRRMRVGSYSRINERAILQKDRINTRFIKTATKRDSQDQIYGFLAQHWETLNRLQRGWALQ